MFKIVNIYSNSTRFKILILYILILYYNTIHFKILKCIF